VGETNLHAQHFKNSRGSIFSKWVGGESVASHDTKRSISEPAFFMLMDIVQKPNLRLYFSQNHLVATLLFGSVDSLGQI
jgi:hypothetical protein